MAHPLCVYVEIKLAMQRPTVQYVFARVSRGRVVSNSAQIFYLTLGPENLLCSRDSRCCNLSHMLVSGMRLCVLQTRGSRMPAVGCPENNCRRSADDLLPIRTSVWVVSPPISVRWHSRARHSHRQKHLHQARRYAHNIHHTHTHN